MISASSADSLERFRNQVFAVFGFSILVGIGVSIFFAKRLTKPVMQLVENSGNLSGETLKKHILIPDCVKLRALTDSLKSMHEQYLEQEEEKSRLESVEITKNLAAGIAHEIKNPINTVGLTLDYLQTNFSPEDPEQRYEFYKLSDNVRKELKRINKIVEGFLKLTKPNVYEFTKEDINEIIQHTISLYEPELIKQGVKINLNLDHELPHIKSDKDKLNQVFSNLIINAMEAMPRGGEITISSELNGEEKVNVTFSDTGIGIPQEDIRNVFSPYYTTKKHGFGLGLSLTHSIIHKHHGKITVKSEKGKGTDFIIHLPLDFQDE
jgi:signal transduction histidine kinase